MELLHIEPVFVSLVPDRLAEVTSFLVRSGAWFVDGGGGTLGERVLDLSRVQELDTHAVFPVMHALAREGLSFSDVFRKVPSACHVDVDNLVALLGLALENEEWDDVAYAACRCPAAQQLDSDFLLQVSTRAPCVCWAWRVRV